MRKLPVFVVALLFGLVSIGCDSNEDDLTDAEIFIGSWTVVEVNDEEGDKTDVFQEGVQDFNATINADGTYSLVVDFVDPQRPDVPLQGTYVVDEGGKTIRLNAGPQVLSFEYDIESEDRIDLSVNEVIVVGAFGAHPDTYDGRVTFTLDRQ